jgi:signal transduction histidine kinase
MLPALFLVDALVDIYDVRRRSIVAILALAAVTAPLTVAAIQDSPAENYARAAIAWQIAGWGLASILHVRREAPEAFQQGARRKTRLVVLGFLVVVVPLSIILGFLTDDSFFIYAMPLITVVVQVALFIGVTQLRFYDIEARSARRGELATDAAALQRQAMVGELTASFAHEVRNPLTGVRSLAQRLAEDEVDDPTRRRYAEVIVREVGRVERIVADLLGVSKRGASPPPETGPTELAPLFDDLRILLAPRADRSNVEVRADAGALRVSASRETLAQVLLNLLLNAIEHSPAGGRVELDTTLDGDSAVIAVRDQGPGIPVADRDRIFEPLVSLRGGSGLGLAVVRRIANESGWAIHVADASGGGAEFRLRVPVATRAHSEGG